MKRLFQFLFPSKDRYVKESKPVQMLCSTQIALTLSRKEKR